MFSSIQFSIRYLPVYLFVYASYSRPAHFYFYLVHIFSSLVLFAISDPAIVPSAHLQGEGDLQDRQYWPG
jgi:hypothetical protein